MGDGRIWTGSMNAFRALSLIVGTETTPEPAPTISEGSVLLPMSAEPVGVPGAALPCGVGSPFSVALREVLRTDKGIED
jgi:hypothetical protein